MWRWRLASVVALALTTAACGLLRDQPAAPGDTQVGVASWYGPGFHGRRTANGEIFDQYELTAAHPSLPLGTRVMVTNLRNGRAVEVRINDRGPYVGGRVIDLSYAAARTIDLVRPGIGPVRIAVLDAAAPRLPLDAAARNAAPAREAVAREGTGREAVGREAREAVGREATGPAAMAGREGTPVVRRATVEPATLPDAPAAGAAARPAASPPALAAAGAPEPPRFVVQVAAFTSAGIAAHLRDRLARRFEDAYVDALDTRDGRYHRVRIGPYAIRRIAVAQAELVSRLGYPAVIVDTAQP